MTPHVSVDLIRSGGNHTVTYEVLYADGCAVRSRTRTSYAEARVVRRNDSARRCEEHRS